jgi:hypothetical protein
MKPEYRRFGLLGSPGCVQLFIGVLMVNGNPFRVRDYLIYELLGMRDGRIAR